MKRITLSLLILAVGVTGCDTTIIPDCDNLGSDGPALKAAAVLEAVEQLTFEADSLANELLGVCEAIGAELGVASPAPVGEETQREATCAAVSAEIQTIIAEASATVTVIVEPAVCDFSITAYADCVAECDINVNADIEVMCTGGELRGQCSGECTGSCSVEGSATCMGECSGTCDGSCSGSCTGVCMGECSAVDSEGNCVGTCDGTCMGTCSATCEGSCSGSCVAEVTGGCEGSCRGSCDVEFVEPRCDGTADVMADAECSAACDAEISAMATCTEPRVTVEFAGTADGGRVADLQRALQRNWPQFIALRARIQSATGAAAEVQAAAADLGRSTASAVICFAAALNSAVEALASFEVSINVTVSVSASVVVE
ncbi:MAG: hypothetical protein ACI9KE_000181 [Polyangiales bacterium]|jgi:hypothetical protein